MNPIRHTVPILTIASLALPTAPLAAQDRSEVLGSELLSDANITQAIEREMFLDSSVNAHRVEVTTRDGVVTLTGRVRSLLDSERSERIAAAIRGVRAVVNRTTVLPASDLSDAEIRVRIEQALRDDPATEAYQVKVTVEDGAVTLGGTADSWEEWILSAEVAKGVRGVRSLRNGIELEEKIPRDDAEVAADIRGRLAWDARIDHELIVVDVKDGRAILSGTTGSAAEYRLARDAAFVRGIRAVDSRALEVEGWAADPLLRKQPTQFAVTDAEIRDAVRDALAMDPRVEERAITARAIGREVLLRGTVGHLAARQAAEQDARNTTGVVDVQNHIRVAPPVERSGEELIRSVRANFERDSYLADQEILITGSNDGSVRLYGTVDSHYYKQVAERAASRVSGVVRVINKLSVDDPRPFVPDPWVDDWQMCSYPLGLRAPRSTDRSDAEILASVEEHLQWSPFVELDRIDVHVEDGRVALEGTVRSWSARRAALNEAFDGGATAVINRLRVGSSDDSRN